MSPMRALTVLNAAVCRRTMAHSRREVERLSSAARSAQHVGA